MTKMLTKEKLLERWNNCLNNENEQIRVDAEHILELFICKNRFGNRQIILKTNKKIKQIKSSNSINVEHLLGQDGKYIVRLELKRQDLDDEFIHLSYDLIESSHDFNQEELAVNCFTEKFFKWQLLLDNMKSELLSDNEIKGLIGELIFIKDRIKTEESLKVLEAWKIHEDAEKDFVFENSWFEIKTVSSSSDKITISSLEQLDHYNNGEIIINFVDKLERDIKEAITLPFLIEQIRQSLQTSIAIQQFNKKLLYKGYVERIEYQEKFFKFYYMNRYCVNENFPMITRSNVPLNIVAARYDINIKAIEGWLIKE